MKPLGIPENRRREETGANELHVFTDHVRALGAAAPLEASHVDNLLAALRSAVRHELRRRGLWESSPAFMGVYGRAGWEDGGKSQGPLEELVAECYFYIFVQRIKSLQAQLASKPNVDGLVLLNVRHFLHERQRAYDPVGAHVFDVLHAAVQQAVEVGELRLIEGDSKVRNDTILAFERETVASGSGRGRTKLASLVSRWNDELLPELVTARGRRQEEVVQRLRQRLPDLLQEGIAVFRFKDLIEPLKADVRRRWAALLEIEQGDIAEIDEEDEAKTLERVVEPELELEGRDFYRKLVSCVSRSLENFDPKTRNYLVVLWQFLRVQAAGGATTKPTTRLNRAIEEGMAAGDEARSLRKIAELLDIPRKRLPGLYQILGERVEACSHSLRRYGKLAPGSRKLQP